ncbi:hypothetical protein [Streptomyces sp. NBC_00154]|uniref:hypothetical protein n=1 Tax=Streptomyces sp. NBC_00154 TaxID=2975670 RepID=UPI00225B2EFB|nr:hypothetical protein [Streptomyces sp. NBC_00154]MCX5317690.1 hypothetical protein [Streptomyces sp. NBC_00154]
MGCASRRATLLADIVPAKAYGRAYGFERMMDNLGTIFGPLLALGLVATLASPGRSACPSSPAS